MSGNHRRRRRKCHLLEITSLTSVPGTAFNINVSPVTLNDGDYYKLWLSNNLAFPSDLTGAEAVQIVVPLTTPVTIQLGDWRARLLRSERVHRDEVLCMVYTNDSVASTPTVPAVPTMLVLDGIDPK